MKIVYLVGAPGSGKSTVMGQVVKDWTGMQHGKPFAHIEYIDAPVPTCQLGKDRGSFSGTDALSTAVIEQVIPWLPTCGYEVLFAEGDRLANARFFEACKQVGTLKVFHLSVPPAVAAARRAGRGSTQDETWVRGRTTKVTNLLSGFVEECITLNGENDAELNGGLIRALALP